MFVYVMSYHSKGLKEDINVLYNAINKIIQCRFVITPQKIKEINTQHTTH